MNQILKIGQVVHTESSMVNCEVEQFIGGGIQGEVYRANLVGKPVALKWYLPDYLKQDPRLRERLETTIKSGPPSDRFLWPIELASSQESATFGYIMPLRESRFKGIVDLMKRRIEPSFRALATAGFELSHSYWQLHAKGLCYRDINFGNVFFDPLAGEVRICDNDNVDVDGKKGIIGGTPNFMAPEIVRGDAMPSTQTDLFSLAVLLFYMFHIHHPLFGKKVLKIHSLDLPARKKLCGLEPVFIFDPVDKSNEAVPKSVDPLGEAGDNALAFWPIYPQFLRNLFTKAFTDGIRDPQSRVRETEWRAAMIRLRDSIVYCHHCAVENFYDADIQEVGKTKSCWSCKKEIRFPARIHIARNIIMLNHDTQLFPHHIDDKKMYDFSRPIAAVNRHPSDPNIWGLKNLSNEKWVITSVDGIKHVEPGRNVTLTAGTKIHFGKIEGEIRI